MAINLVGMQARFPGLIDYNDLTVADRLQQTLDDAIMDVDEGMMLLFYGRAVYNLAAHRYTTQAKLQDAGDSSTSLLASQVTADGMSGTYAVPGGDQIGLTRSQYLTTSYGQEYLRLLRQQGTGARVV